MDDAITPLLWCGIGGWFLFSYLLSEGNGKGRLRNLLVTAFLWVICMDTVGIAVGIILPLEKKAGAGWRFVAWGVGLPYALCLLRLWWLRRRSRAGRNRAVRAPRSEA